MHIISVPLGSRVVSEKLFVWKKSFIVFRSFLINTLGGLRCDELIKLIIARKEIHKNVPVLIITAK